MKKYFLYLDRQVTRRKRFSHVCDESGEVLFTGRDARQCFEWLYEQERGVMLLVLGGLTWPLNPDEPELPLERPGLYS